MDSLNTGDYHTNSLSQHPKDNHLCDDVSRWWLERHECQLDDQNVPVYDARILFDPKRKPNVDKDISWTDTVHLTDASCFIHYSFNCDSRSNIISTKTFIALGHWEFLLISCNVLGIVFSIISALANVTLKKTRIKR